jgi:TolA-binding protein
MKTAPSPIRNSVRTAVLGALMSFAGATLADQPSSEQQQIEALRRQLEAVQNQIKDLADQNRRLLEREQLLEQQMAQSATAPAPNPVSGQGSAAASPLASNPVPPAANPVPAASNPVPPASTPPSSNPVPGGTLALANAASPFGNGLKLWGYGEIYYTRPTRDEKEAQADLARAVFGIGYTFDSSRSSSSTSIASSIIMWGCAPGSF